MGIVEIIMGIGGVVIVVLGALLKASSSGKKLAETERDTYLDIAVENAKVIEDTKHVEKAKDSVDKLTDDAIRNKLLQQARDRK